MTASSPGPDDRSGIVELLGGYHAQRTASQIIVYDDDWTKLFVQANLGQTDAVLTETAHAYEIGRQRGHAAGRDDYRLDLLRMLGARPVAREEG